jgi:hypothetical protein
MTSQALFSQSTQNEWVVDFRFKHYMDKVASLFTSLDKATYKNIYVANAFSLKIVGFGDVPCRHGNIVDVYDVSKLSANLLLVSQLT